jgi:uncharacterized protein with HEPN domain
MLFTAGSLQLVAHTGEDILVLIDYVEQPEFQRSRLTRRQVTAQLLVMAEALNGLPAAAHAAMPEVDWPAWRHLGQALREPLPPADETAWFAARSLVPATLSWLRLYRQAEPRWFAFSA